MAKKNIPYDQKYYDPEIECMPRPELEQMQLERLQEMVQYAYDNTVYYKRSFDEAGVAPSDIKTLKDLEKFPFIDKKTERETQHVGTFFGEMCSVPEEDVIFMATSSGSTGVPTVSPFTQEDFDLWQDTEARLFWQAGMRPNDRYVHGLNFALYVGGPDVIGAQRLGALAIWVGAVPSDRLLFVLKQYQPTVIWTSPSYAWTLGEKIKEKGLDPRTDFSIHTIIVAGEAGGSITSTREAIENLWDAKVVDFFGLSDIYGACAAACHEGAIDIINGKAKLVRENFCDGFGDCLPGCPTGAITFEEREAPAYDEAAVQENKKKKELQEKMKHLHEGGCPGSRMRMLEQPEAAESVASAPVQLVSRLRNWPVQIKLAPIHAPYFEGAKLLIAADCTAYAYANFHQEFMRGKVTLIGCPKLDAVDYSEKLTEILRSNDIQSVTILRMEVPCCGGLEMAAKKALQTSGKFIPWQVVTISIDGKILE